MSSGLLASFTKRIAALRQRGHLVPSGYNPAGVPRPFHELLEANLRREAFLKGMPLESVARTAGISIERLLAIFSGDWSPDLQLIGRIAESVGLTAAELLTEPDLN